MSSTRSFTSAIVPSTSSAIFTFMLDVILFVFMIFLMGVMIANIVYFRRIASDSSQTNVSHTAAVSMVGISIFILIVTIIGLIYYGFLVIYNFFMVFRSMDAPTTTVVTKNNGVEMTTIPGSVSMQQLPDYGTQQGCTQERLNAQFARGVASAYRTSSAPLLGPAADDATWGS